MTKNDQSLHAVVLQLKEEVRGLWRFRWRAMLAAWVALVLGCLAVSALPNKYQASSKFFVDASSRLGPLVQGLAVETNVDTQVAYIRQMMLSRPHLTELAESPELAAYTKSAMERSDLVDTLRDEVQIIPVRGGEMAKGLLLEFKFEYPNREAALFVVKSLVDSFVEESQGSNIRKASEAQIFLTQQLKELEVKLTEADSRLAAFKRENFGVLPGQGGDYFSRMQTEREALDKARNQLGVLQSQRATLSAQLRGQSPLVPSASAPSDSAGGQKDIGSRIKESEAKLEDLLLRFTEKHPEVIALRETISELRTRREQEIAALRSGGADSGSLATADNPVYQSIQEQISKIDVDIAANRAEATQRERRINELQRSIDTAPEVEAQLASLNRDYSVTKGQYESLLAGLQKARISESAEETGVVKFQMIEPPTAKSKPVAPKRVLMLIAVFMAACGGGLALAFAMHQLNPVFSSIHSVSQVLDLPVLGTISRGGAADLEAERLADSRRFATTFAAMLIVFATALLLRDWTAGLARAIAG